MSRQRIWLYLVAAVLAGINLGLWWYGGSLPVAGSWYQYFDGDQNSTMASTTVVLPAELHSGTVYDEAWANAIPLKTPSDTVFAGVVPHHLFVKEHLAGYFKSLQSQKYQTVVIIGPNHYQRGGGLLITSDAAWDTPSGRLQPNHKVIAALTKDGFVQTQHQPLAGDHSITAILPFVSKTWPQATVVPIITQAHTDLATSQQLGAALAAIVDPETTLVLASVDFSHYQPVAVADFHDDYTWGLLQSFDLGRLNRAEIDSASSLAAVGTYAQAVGAQHAERVAHTNSSALLKQPFVPGTSHQFITYHRGSAVTTTTIGMLFFGDLMVDRNVGSIIAERGFESILDPLAGEERRLFGSVDMLSANLEGAMTPNGEHWPPQAGFDFAFRPETVRGIAQRYGFNYFNLANNHAFDQGSDGVRYTRQQLTDWGVDHAGCIEGAVGECSSTTMTIEGVTIGMASFSDAAGSLDHQGAAAVVRQLKEQNNVVIAQVHWGPEYDHQFSQRQQLLAHALVDAGADLIIGHHPHVVQGVEIYKDKPIYYSLGNFLFDQWFSQETQEGLGLGFILELQNNKITTLTSHLIPIGWYGRDHLGLFSGAARQRVLTTVANHSPVPEAMRADLSAGRLMITY